MGNHLCGCSSIGRASAFQAECRGFEPLHPLLKTLQKVCFRGFFYSLVYIELGGTCENAAMLHVMPTPGRSHHVFVLDPSGQQLQAKNNVNDAIVIYDRHHCGIDAGSAPIACHIIDGFTLQNGNSPIGGGILTDGSPILLNCVVRDNIAQYGGGLYALNSNSGLPSLSNMRFCNNSPDDIFGKWEDAGVNIFEDDCGDTLPCPADVSGDSVVNVADLLAIIDAWGGSSPDADVNDDGIVDVIDLLEVVGSWGPC